MREIIIGTHRRPRARPARTVAIVVGLLGIALIVAYWMFVRATRYVVPDGELPGEAMRVDHEGRLRYGVATVERVGALQVVRARGAPHAIGAAHGRLLGDDITAIGASLLPTVTAAIPRDGWFGDMRYGWRLRELDDGIPGHQLVELAGVMRGAEATTDADVDYATLIRTQAALDIGVAVPDAADANSRAVASSLSVVVPLRGAEGDRLAIARSFGLPGAADDGAAIRRALAVSFVRPDDVLAYASVGWPGLVGVVSGINAEGVAVMVHPATTEDVDPGRAAQPIPLLAREVLENARDLDQAVAILEHAKPLGAAAIVVVDGKARTWAVVELSPTRVETRRSPASSAVTGVLEHDAFADDPGNDRARRVRPSLARAARATELTRGGIDDAAGLVALLRDRRGAGGRPLPPGHRAAIDDVGAVHVAVIDASSMLLWVAPTPGEAFEGFDLRHELRGEPAAPAQTVPAAVDRDPSVDATVVDARRELRAARGARRRGNRRAAAERAARALLLAPRLPAALAFAADLAHDSGDNDTARTYYERYLDAPPDDGAAEQEARALLGR